MNILISKRANEETQKDEEKTSKKIEEESELQMKRDAEEERRVEAAEVVKINVAAGLKMTADAVAVMKNETKIAEDAARNARIQVSMMKMDEKDESELSCLPDLLPPLDFDLHLI